MSGKTKLNGGRGAGRRRMQPSDPVVAATLRIGALAGRVGAVWLARLAVLTLIPLRLAVTLGFAFANGLWRGLWAELKLIQKEQKTAKVARAEQVPSDPQMPSTSTSQAEVLRLVFRQGDSQGAAQQEGRSD